MVRRSEVVSPALAPGRSAREQDPGSPEQIVPPARVTVSLALQAQLGNVVMQSALSGDPDALGKVVAGVMQDEVTGVGDGRAPGDGIPATLPRLPGVAGPSALEAGASRLGAHLFHGGRPLSAPARPPAPTRVAKSVPDAVAERIATSLGRDYDHLLPPGRALAPARALLAATAKDLGAQLFAAAPPPAPVTGTKPKAEDGKAGAAPAPAPGADPSTSASTAAAQKNQTDAQKLAELKAAGEPKKPGPPGAPGAPGAPGDPAAPAAPDAPTSTPAASGAGSSKVSELETKRADKVWEIERLDTDLRWTGEDTDRSRTSIDGTQETLQDVQGRLQERTAVIQQRARAAQATQQTPPSPDTDGQAVSLQHRAEDLPKKIKTDSRRKEGLDKSSMTLEERKALAEEELAAIDEELASARQAAQAAAAAAAASGGGGGGGGGGGASAPPPRINRPETSKLAAPLLRAQKAKHTEKVEKLKLEVTKLEKNEDKDLKAKLDDAKKSLDGVVAEIGDWTQKVGASERAVATLEGRLEDGRKNLVAAKAAADAEQDSDNKSIAKIMAVSGAQVQVNVLTSQLATEKTNLQTARTNLQTAKDKKPKFETAQKELQAKYDLTCKDLVAKRSELEELEKYGETWDADVAELEKGSLLYADILAKYGKYPVTVKPINLKPGEVEAVPEIDQQEVLAAEAKKKADEEAKKNKAAETPEEKSKREEEEKKNRDANAFNGDMNKATEAQKKEAAEKKKADEAAAEAAKTPEQKAADAAKKVEDEKKKKAEEEQKLVEKYAAILAGDPRKKDQAIAELAESTKKNPYVTAKTPDQLKLAHKTSTEASAAKLANIKDLKSAKPEKLAEEMGIPAAQVRAYQLEVKRKEMEERAKRYFPGDTNQAMTQLWKSLDDRGMSTSVSAGAQLPADAMMDQLVHADQKGLPPELQAMAGAAKAGARADYDAIKDPKEKERIDAEAEKKRTAANQVEKNYSDAAEIARTVGLKDVKSAQSYIAGLQKSMGLEKPEDAIKYLKMHPDGAGKTADAAMREKVAKARMATPEEKTKLLQEIGKEYGPRALMGVALQGDLVDPDGLVKGPVANDALQAQLAEIKKLPPEKRYDAMKELSAISGQPLNSVVAASENREKKDQVVGSYTSAVTDASLSKEERQKKLEEIASARGLKLEEMQTLMDKQRARTQQLLDAASKNPEVNSLREQLANPNTLEPREKLQAKLARASGVSLSLIASDDKQTEWTQKKDKWAKKFAMEGNPEGAAEFVAAHAKKYGIKPDEVEDHLRYSEDPDLPAEAKAAKAGISTWDQDPKNMSAADQALKKDLDAAGVKDPRDLKRVPTSLAELEDLKKKDPVKAKELVEEYAAYCDKRDRLISKLDERLVDDDDALALLRSFSPAERAALLRQNPVDEDGRPILASFRDGVSGDELAEAEKLFSQGQAYNSAITAYDPAKQGAIDAKKKWAENIDQSMHLQEDAAKALGVPPAEARAHIQAMAVSMGVSPREALDLLTGKPVKDSKGKLLVMSPAAAGGATKTLPPEEMQNRLAEIQTLSKDERLVALSQLKAEYALDPQAMLAVVYHVPAGTDPSKNPAFAAQLQSIQAMPPGTDKNAAMLRLSQHSGTTARQMVDAIATIEARTDVISKMHAIRDLPEGERKAAMERLEKTSGKSAAELEDTYATSIAELETRLDPKLVARLKDVAKNGTASPMALKANLEEICSSSGMSPQQAQMLVESLRGGAFQADMKAKLGDQQPKLLQGASDKNMTPEAYANYLARTPESMLAGDPDALAIKKSLGEAGYAPKFSPEETEAAKKAGILADPWDPQYQELSGKLKDQLTGDCKDSAILTLLKQMTPAQRALFAREWEDMRIDRTAKDMSVPDTLQDIFEDALQFGDQDTGVALLKEAQEYDPQAELKKQFAIVDTEGGDYPKKRDTLTAELMKGKGEGKADSDVIKDALRSMTLAERAQFLRDMEGLKNQLTQAQQNGRVEGTSLPPDLGAFAEGDEDLTRWLKDAKQFMSADPSVQWREQAKSTQEMFTASKQAQEELHLPDIRTARMRLDVVQKANPGLSPQDALDLLAGRDLSVNRQKLSSFEQKFVTDATNRTAALRILRGEAPVVPVPAAWDPNRVDLTKVGAYKADAGKVDGAHANLTKYFEYDDPVFGMKDLNPDREAIAQVVRDLNPAELAELDKKFGGKLEQLLNENVNNLFYGKSEITRKLADMRNFQESTSEKPYREMMLELSSVDPSRGADVSTPQGLAQRMAYLNSLPIEMRIAEINKMQAERRAKGADPGVVMDAILFGPGGRKEGMPLGPAFTKQIAEIQKLPWYAQEASMDALATLAHQDPAAFREAATKTQKDLKIAAEYNKLAELPASERAVKLEELAKENEVSVEDLEEMHYRLEAMGHFPPPKVKLDGEQRARLEEVSKLSPGPERTAALEKLCADTGIQPRDLIGCINDELTAQRKTRQESKSQQKEAEGLLARAKKDDPDAMRSALEKYKDKPEELKKVLEKFTPEQRKKFDADMKDCFDGGFWHFADDTSLLQMREIVGAADRAKPEPLLPPGASPKDSEELQHLMRLDETDPRKQQQLEALREKLALPDGDWAKLQSHANWGYEAFEEKAKLRLRTLNEALSDSIPNDAKIREILGNTSPDLLLAMERHSGGKLSIKASEVLGGATAQDFALKLDVARQIEFLPPEQRKEKTTELRVNDKAERLTALLAGADASHEGWDGFVGGMGVRDLNHEQLVETLRDCSDEELKKLNDRFGGTLLARIEEARQKGASAAGVGGAFVGGLVPGLGLYMMANRPDENDQRSILNRLRDATRKPGEALSVDPARVDTAFAQLKDNFDDIWNDAAMIRSLQGLNGAEIMALKAKFEADPDLGGNFVERIRADLDGDEAAKFVAIMADAQDEVDGRHLRTDMKATAYDLVVKDKIRELQRDPKNRAKSEVELWDLATRDGAALEKAVEEKLSKVQTSANALYKAIDGWGDDTDALLSTLAGLTPEEADLVKVEYRRHYGKDFETQMKEELSSPGLWESIKTNALGEDAVQGERDDLQIALKLMNRESRVDGLRDYFGRMSFSETAWTEDEDLIFSTLEGLSPEERTLLVAGPEGRRFVELLKRDLGDVDQELVEAYVAIDPESGLAMANPAHVAAVKIKQAMKGSGEWWSFSSLGTDEDKLLAAFDKLTPEQVKEAERYYDRNLSDGSSSFMGDICDELSLDGEEMAVVDAEMRGDKVSADIHRLRYAAEGWGTNEKLIEDTLKAGAEGRGGRTKEHLDRVRAGFNQLYGQKGGAYATGDGRSAMDVMIDEEFSGEGLSYGSEKTFFKQLADKGEADPEVELLYAMEGFGTDEERVKKIVSSYAGKSPAERRLLSQRFQEISPDGESLEDWLESDFGGTELFQLKIDLMGTPTTPEEMLELARLRYAFERGEGNGLVSSFMDGLEGLGAHSTGSLCIEEMSDIQGMFDSEGQFVGSREELDEKSAWLKMDLDNYRTVRDTVADYAATAIQIAGAALCAVIPGLQGGAALIIANLVIAVAATGVKLAIKGSGADWQEGAMDLATAVVGAMTAGVGDKFAALGKNLGGKFAAMLATGAKMTKFIQEVMATILESGVESFMNTLLTSEQAWEEGDWAFAKHMMKGTFGGIAQSLGAKGVGALAGGTALGRRLEAIEGGDPVSKAGIMEHLALKYADNVLKAGAKQVLNVDNWEQWGDGKGGYALFKNLFVDTAKDTAINVVGSRSEGVRAHKREQAQEHADRAAEQLAALRANPDATPKQLSDAEKAHSQAQAKISALDSTESARRQIAREDQESARSEIDHHHRSLADAERTVDELGSKPKAELSDDEVRRLETAQEQIPKLRAELPRLTDTLNAATDDEHAAAEAEADRRTAIEARRQHDAARAEAALERDPPADRDDPKVDPAQDKRMTDHAIEVAHALATGKAKQEAEPEVPPEPAPVRREPAPQPHPDAEPEIAPAVGKLRDVLPPESAHALATGDADAATRVFADPENQEAVRTRILEAGSREEEHAHLAELVASFGGDAEAVRKAFGGDENAELRAKAVRMAEAEQPHDARVAAMIEAERSGRVAPADVPAALDAAGGDAAPRGRRVDLDDPMGDWGELGDGRAAKTATPEPVGETWQIPTRMSDDPELAAHQRDVEARTAKIREQNPDLSEHDAVRMARNEALHAIADDVPNATTRATAALAAATDTGDHPAALHELQQITDPRARRELDLELRRTGSSLDAVLATLPPDVRGPADAHLDALRPHPDDVARATRLLADVEAARAAMSSGDPAAVTAYNRARQEAVDHLIAAYGIDDTGARARDRGAKTGLQAEASAIVAPALHAPGDALARPEGVVLAFESLFGARADGSFDARSPGLIAAAIGHEAEVHLPQLNEGRMGAPLTRDERAAGAPDTGTGVNEVEAYAYMMRNADRFGLTDTDLAPVQRGLDEHLRILRAQTTSDPIALDGPLPAGVDPVVAAALRRLMVAEPRVPSADGDGVHDPSRLGHRTSDAAALGRVLGGDFSLTTPAEDAPGHAPWVGQAPQRSLDAPILPAIAGDLSGAGKFVDLSGPAGAATEAAGSLADVQTKLDAELAKKPRQQDPSVIAALRTELVGLAEAEGLIPGQHAELARAARVQEAAEAERKADAAAARIATAEENVGKTLDPTAATDGAIAALQRLANHPDEEVRDSALHAIGALEAARNGDPSRLGEIEIPEKAQNAATAVDRALGAITARQRAEGDVESARAAATTAADDAAVARSRVTEHDEAHTRRQAEILAQDPNGTVARAFAEARQAKAAEIEAHARYRSRELKASDSLYDLRKTLAENATFINENGQEASWVINRPLDRLAQPSGPATESALLSPLDPAVDAELRARSDAQLAMLQGDGTRQKQMNDASENLGGMAADVHAANMGWTPVPGLDPSLVTPKGSNAFDRVYRDTDGNLVVVECKGGASPLDSRMSADGTLHVQQGSREYIEAIIAAIRKREEAATPGSSPNADVLQAALDAGKIRSMSVQQGIHPDGTIGRARVQEFDATENYDRNRQVVPKPGQDIGPLPVSSSDEVVGTSSATGARYRGDSMDADPVRTQGAIDDVMTKFSNNDDSFGVAGVSRSENGGFHIDAGETRATSATVVVKDPAEMKDGAVAQYRRKDDGTWEIQVSAGADPAHVHRALAHECVEIRALTRDVRTDIEGDTSLLAPGRPMPSRDAKLSPHDEGRLAELAVLHAELARTTDAATLVKKQADLGELLDHLGLSGPAAGPRRAWLAESLGEDHPAVKAAGARTGDIASTDFPMPDLVRRVAFDPDAANPVPGGFQEAQARIARARSEQLVERLAAATTSQEREAALEAAFQSVREDLVALARATNPTDPKIQKMSQLIPDHDPNVDPFGDLSTQEKTPEGTQTFAARQRVATGDQIRGRFGEPGSASGRLSEDGDVLQNVVVLPNGTPIDGNQLVRGRTAEAIDAEKGHKYGYADDAEPVMTRTGTAANMQVLHQAGVETLASLHADPSGGVERFADAAYYLYQGLMYNRGGDAAIRTFLAASAQPIFGRAIQFPQDLDVRAFVHDQAAFRTFMAEHLRAQGVGAAASDVGNAPVVGTSAATGDLYKADGGADVDPVRTQTAVKGVLAGIAENSDSFPVPGITHREDGGLDITTWDGRSTSAKIAVVDPAKMKDGAVAQYVRTADGAWEIQVSAGADPSHVRRALAHECAEIRALTRDGRTDIEGDVSLLAPTAGIPAKGAKLTPHDEGRVAELAVLHQELAATSDPAVIAKKKAELDELLGHLGLAGRDGTARLRWLEEKLGLEHPGVKVARRAAGEVPLENAVRDAQILAAVDTVHAAISKGVDKVDHAKINAPMSGAAPLPGQLLQAGLAGLEPHEVVRFLAVWAQRYGTAAQSAAGMSPDDMVALLASRGMKSRDVAEAQAHLSGDVVAGARAAVLNALGNDEFLRNAKDTRPSDGGVITVLADARRPVESAGTAIKRAAVEDNTHIIEILSNLTPAQRTAVLDGEIGDGIDVVSIRTLIDRQLVDAGPVRHKWNAVQADNDLDMQAALVAAHLHEAMEGTRQKRDVKGFVGRIMGAALGADAVTRRDDVLALVDRLRGNPALYEQVCEAYIAQSRTDGKKLSDDETGRALLSGDVKAALGRREWDVLDTVMSPLLGIGSIFGHARTAIHAGTDSDEHQARGHQQAIAATRFAHAEADASEAHREIAAKLAELRPGKRYTGDELAAFVQAATLTDEHGAPTPNARLLRQALVEAGLPLEKLDAYGSEVRKLEQTERAHQILAAVKLEKLDALPGLLEDKDYATTRRALLAKMSHPNTSEDEQVVLQEQLNAAEARMNARKAVLNEAMGVAMGLDGTEAPHAMAKLIGEISRRSGTGLEDADESWSLTSPLSLDGRNFAKWADKAWESGALADHEALFFATHGIGSDPLKVVPLLQGKTPAQIDALATEFIRTFVPTAQQAAHLENPRKFLDDLIADEFGGRVGLPVRLAAQGDPAAIFDPANPPKKSGTTEADPERTRTLATLRLEVELAQVGIEVDTERGSRLARGAQDLAEQAHAAAGTKAATGKQLDAAKAAITLFHEQHGERLRSGDALAWKEFQALRKQCTSLAAAAGAYRDLLAKDVVTVLARATALAGLGITALVKDPTSLLLGKVAAGAVSSAVGTAVERGIRGEGSMSSADILKSLTQNALGSASSVAFGAGAMGLKDVLPTEGVAKFVLEQATTGVPRAAVGGAIKGAVDPAVLRTARKQDKIADQVQGSLGDGVVGAVAGKVIHEGADHTPLQGHSLLQPTVEGEIGGEAKTASDKTAWEAARAKGTETAESRAAAERAANKAAPGTPTPASLLSAQDAAFRPSEPEVAPIVETPPPARREMPPVTIIRPRQFGDPEAMAELVSLLPQVHAGTLDEAELSRVRGLTGAVGLWCAAHGPFADSALRAASAGTDPRIVESALARLGVPIHPEIGSEAHVRASESAAEDTRERLRKIEGQLATDRAAGRTRLESIVVQHRRDDAIWLLQELEERLEAARKTGAPTARVRVAVEVEEKLASDEEIVLSDEDLLDLEEEVLAAGRRAAPIPPGKG